MSLITEDQKVLMRKAHESLKLAFPNDGMQVIFNLSPKHKNMNYNIKASGMDTKENK